MTTTEKIKEARAALNEQKQKKAELEGRRKTLMERLWKEHKLRSISAAEKRVDELEEQISDREKELAKLVKKLDAYRSEIEEASE